MPESYDHSGLWIEMLPAGEGDCIFITIPGPDIRILIDGGPKETSRYLPELSAGEAAAAEVRKQTRRSAGSHAY